MIKRYRRAVFDLESDGLLDKGTRIWCIVLKDFDTEEVYKFPPESVSSGIELMQNYKFLIGHNICGFDVPFIRTRGYPDFQYNKLRDTLCMSKLFNPERQEGHSLDSYGKLFKRYKPAHEDWSRYSEAMLHRCSEDVEINSMLYQYLLKKYCDIDKPPAKRWPWSESLELEQDFAIDQAYQEMTGVDIDRDLALDLVEKIDEETDRVDPILLSRMPKRVVPYNKTVTKIFKMNGYYTKQVEDWFKI